MRFYATPHNGKTDIGKVSGDMDTGYGSTSKRLAECSVCLVRDNTRETTGVLTPSIAMGEPLIN